MPGATKPLPEELPVIEELVKAGYEFERDRFGWGFHHLDDAALEHVRRLKTIAFLDLFEACDVGRYSDAGLACLAENRSLVCLRVGPGITDAGLAHLSALTQLEKLRIDSAKDVTDSGAAHLAGLTNLETLSLQFTQVTDAALKHLAGMTRLRSLSVFKTGVTKTGIRKLRASLRECEIEA